MTWLNPSIRTGALVGGLCLSLAAAPAFAHPHDDDESMDNSKGKKEIRVYVPDYDDDDSEEAQVRGGYLGVRVQDITRELQQARELPTTDGALVNRVEADSPAATAGIKRGDVILEVNKHKVDDAEELIRQMQQLEPGAKVPVVVYSSGARRTVNVTLAKRPPDMLLEAPRFRRHWVQSYGDMPDIPELNEHLDRIRVNRMDIERQLDEIQAQLRDLQKLEEEVRALREELRQSRERQNRNNSKPD
jgi:C-terminal processing protease CtpA/Prc